MAKKSFFGKLAEAGAKWLKQTFGERISQPSSQPVHAPQPQPISASQLAKIESEKESVELQKLQKQIAPIIEQANRRIELIKAQGLLSMAVNRVEEEQGHDYFDIDDLNTKGELIAVATAARVFLNDEQSTIEGSRIYTAQLRGEQYRGQFGNQWNKYSNNFKTFNTATIDEETAKVVFRNYRKIEELRAAEITGDGAFGSENLIIAMYDAQVRGMDSFMVGMDQLDSFYRMKTKEWRDRFESSNSVADIQGLYEDYDRGLYF